MTPKEKAKDLVEKIGNVQLYIYLEPSNIEGKIKYFDNDLVKECALIAVNEILDKDGYNNNYWQAVKQEIVNI